MEICAAIDLYHLAGQKACQIRDKIEHCSGHIIWDTPTFKCNSIDCRAAALLSIKCFMKWRLKDQTRRNGIHSHALGGKLFCQPTCEAKQTGLCCAIGDSAGTTAVMCR